MLRKAFTLLEVNLAIMVMAGGLLSSVILFSLAYGESSQSNEDVASAAYAEEVMGRMVLALGDTNIAWSAFKRIGDSPTELWADYFDNETGEVKNGSESKARTVFGTVMGNASASGVNATWPTKPDGIEGVGLVVTRSEGSPVVRIAFRASRKERMLMSAPVYFTEVVFQGRRN